ncbi:MAG: cell division protein FtsQ/DivIB [Prochlorotrichaceae cyanobacterium]
MSNFSRDFSREALAERRLKLRRQRGWKVIRTAWRTLLVSGMATGLVWSLTFRFWVLNTPEQVQIEGTELLSPETIRDLLPLQYPLSLLQVEPQNLVKTLESSAPIAQAAVTREVVPPRLIIRVQERRPVAQASLAPGTTGSVKPGQEEWGLLDERGFWIPLEQFTNLQSNKELPPLKVLGIRPDLRSDWTALYKTILSSPVKVTEIDWRNTNNLILKTDMGVVHLGVYSSQFPLQLQTLDRLRNLPQHPQAKGMDYIDLRDPQAPFLQIRASPVPPPSKS